MLSLAKSKEIELEVYYGEIYTKYIPYISNRLWGEDSVYGSPIDGVNVEKFNKVKSEFATYMLSLLKLGITPCESTVGAFLYSVLVKEIGRGKPFTVNKADDYLRGVVEVVKVMLNDINGRINLSGLVNPLITSGDATPSNARVIVPEFCKVEEEDMWDGVKEYRVTLKNTYRVERELPAVVTSNVEGIDTLTLADSNFGKRYILSYKIKGDSRGEIVCKYWTVLFKGVLEYFKEHRREDFFDILNRGLLKGKKKLFVSSDKEGMDSPQSIGEGVYMEGHTSPNQIKSLLSILFVNLGLSLEDLEIYVLEGKKDRRVL